MRLLYQHADVVAQDLAKSLVDLPGVALGAQVAPELALYHRVGGLDVAPLVVVLQERLALVHEQVVHLRPHGGFGGLHGVRLERDEGHAPGKFHGS